jgi:hypothetical protein
VGMEWEWVMTPSKLTMGERRPLVDRTVELVVGVQKEFPFAERCAK